MIQIFLFGSDECEKCDIQKEILSGLNRQYQYLDVDSDQIENMMAMQKYDVDDIPTLVIITNNKFFKYEGILASHKIRETIEKMEKA